MLDIVKNALGLGYRFHPDMTVPSYENFMFVFGSNLQGLHYGGSARAANLNYGAEMGVGEGPTGKAYALPTCIEPGGTQTMTLAEIKEYVVDLMEFAEYHSDITFFITRTGCGVAGFKDSDIAPLFKGFPLNADFPEEWRPFLG